MSSKTRKQQIAEMLADFPDDSFLRYGLAMEYVSEGDDTGALKAFQELFAVDPLYVPGYLQAGQALTRLDRIEDARKMFQSGIEVARKVGDMHALGEMQGFLDGLD